MFKINTHTANSKQLPSPIALPNRAQSVAAKELIKPSADNPLLALDELTQWEANPEENSHLQVRWPQDAMPLTVWIEPPPSNQPGFDVTALLVQTMRQWESASQGMVRFASPANGPIPPAKPHIIVKWSEETVLGRDYEVGHTNRSVKGTQIRQAEITLIFNPIIDAHLNPLQRQQRLIATILHETGHALGLEHSESKKDVMHHRGWQHTSLSENDVARLVRLYKKGNLQI